jgi:serine/threonine protein kinase
VIKDLRAIDPESVGPYRLLGRLGIGGMGQVYLAKSPGGRLVAIKLIRPDLAEERGFRARFASEITAAKNVSGIYTAAVVDADAEAEYPWMATVYVPGPSLTDAVEQNGPLPVKSVLALAAGLAEALQAIHRAGLVHRDLKPSNVLLANDGPRVIDFGISLALERSMMTSTGILLGSPGFMSPEQARGQREVGAPSDVFNLGAVLAFAATGSSPFGVGPTPALLYRVVNELPDLTTVPDRVRPLIWHCLAKNPGERPTPAEVLALLSDDVDVITGEWLPPSIAEAMDRYSQKAQVRLPSPDEPGQPPAEPAPASATVAETWTASATILDPASATRAEHGLVPATSLDLVPGLATAVWPGSPGDTGGTLPPRRRHRRRMRGWRWPLTAAAAVVVVAAAAAVLIPAQSSGGSPKRVTSTASLAGDTTPAPAPASGPTTASLATIAAARPTKRATSRRAGHTPAPSASPTAAQASAPPSATASHHAPAAAPTPAQGATSAPAAPPTTSAPAPAQTPTQTPTTQAPTPTPTPSWSPTTQPTSGPTPSPEPAVTTAGARYHHHRSAPR